MIVECYIFYIEISLYFFRVNNCTVRLTIILFYRNSLTCIMFYVNEIADFEMEFIYVYNVIVLWSCHMVKHKYTQELHINTISIYMNCRIYFNANVCVDSHIISRCDICLQSSLVINSLN